MNRAELDRVLRLYEAVDCLAELEVDNEIPYDVAELEDGTALVICAARIEFLDMPVSLGMGYLNLLEQEAEAPLPEDAVTIIWEGADICYEKARLIEALTDYLDSKGFHGQVEQLKCRLVLSKQPTEI